MEMLDTTFVIRPDHADAMATIQNSAQRGFDLSSLCIVGLTHGVFAIFLCQRLSP